MNNTFYTEKEYRDVYKKIKQTLEYQKSKENYPLAALVGGQPGSGKSQLSNFIRSQNENTIIVDGDFIREFHPHIDAIEKEYGKDYPKLTQPFVNRAVEQLIDEFSKDHYNLIIEGTLRDINIPLKTAEMLDEREYLIELYVVATNKSLSWQSTIARGDEMIANGDIPRYVDQAHHDAIVDSLPKTVKALSENDLFYNVVIMRRDQSIVYDKIETPDLDSEEIMKKELDGERVPTIEEILAKEEDVTEKKSVETLIDEIKEASSDKNISNDLHRNQNYER